MRHLSKLPALFGDAAACRREQPTQPCPQRQKGCQRATAESFSLMSISRAHLTSWLSQPSPFFPRIMASDRSLMIHFFDKNHSVLALRDKTLLDLTQNSGSTRPNKHTSLREASKVLSGAIAVTAFQALVSSTAVISSYVSDHCTVYRSSFGEGAVHA